MDRVFIIVCYFFFSLSCFAQQRHLTFMGIPIDGTINSFETKLKSKGIMPDSETNRSLPYGKRMFKGVYLGHHVCFTVLYTGRSKTVYSIEIGFSDENQNVVNSFESDFVEGVKRKYRDSHLLVNDNDFDKTIYIYNKTGVDNYSWETVVGIMKTEWMTIVGRPKEGYSSLREKYIRSVKIYYIDKMNLEKREMENSSDI